MKEINKRIEKALYLSDKIDTETGGILKDISELSDEDKIKLTNSGVIHELHNSLERLGDNLDKLDNTIKSKL